MNTLILLSSVGIITVFIPISMQVVNGQEWNTTEQIERNGTTTQPNVKAEL
jgi:hypothetical protein